jgi:hypothetical protein
LAVYQKVSAWLPGLSSRPVGLDIATVCTLS